MGDNFPETHFFGMAGQIASKALGRCFFFFFFFRKAGDVCLACFFGNFLRGRVYNMNPLWSCGTGWKSPEREKRFGVLKT